MSAEAFKRMHRFMCIIIAALGIFIFPISFYADSNPVEFKIMDIGFDDDISNPPFYEYRKAGLSVSDHSGTSMEMTSEDSPIILVINKGQPGEDSYHMSSEREEIYQLATEEQFSVRAGLGKKSDWIFSILKIDSTSWLNFSTDQILLAFGLMGFLSSRKRKSTKNSDQ